MGASFAMPVAQWAVWPPAGIGASAAAPAAPDVSFVDASLRRRLGPLARMMLHVAQSCVREVPEARLVFASRHGELQYTVQLLRTLAAEEPLSPTTFSLAVHNAASGLFSILRGDRSASTALAAGGETLGHALLEAASQHAEDPSRPVLMVYADAPLPAEYREFADAQEGDAPQGCAVAVLIRAGAERRVCVRTANPARAGKGSQAGAFIRHLLDRVPVTWSGSRREWAFA